MKPVWNHPELGKFEYDEDCGRWIGVSPLPAFQIFTWPANSADAGNYELAFNNPDGDEPSADAVKIASLVIAHQEKLAALVTLALWEDFNGRGPDSGVWWRGDMKEVSRNFGYGDRPAPQGANDLLPVMRFNGITIYEEIYGHEKPIAELGFWALFEEEHGVGLLTDGNVILGMGYIGDAMPFGVS